MFLLVTFELSQLTVKKLYVMHFLFDNVQRLGLKKYSNLLQFILYKLYQITVPKLSL